MNPPLSRVLSATALLALAPIASAQTTSLVSVGTTGAQADAGCLQPAVSADGRCVVFQSSATNLVPLDANGIGDVFVRDVAAGTTECVSVDPLGVPRGGLEATLSADGRYVAFASNADGLVPGDANGASDVFVRDRLLAATVCVSVDAGGTAVGGFFARISADGRHVTFASFSSALVAGDANGLADVFVRDLATGVTTRVSVDAAGGDADGASFQSACSQDGRYVAFRSAATDLVAGDTNGFEDVYLRDIVAGTTSRVSVDPAGLQANGGSGSCAISADGRWIAFASNASNLVAGDTNLWSDVFLHDRLTGATTRASVDSAGAQASWFSDHPAISADGRYVAFASLAADLVPADGNGAWDVFVHDRVSGRTKRASVDAAGSDANAESERPSLSADGRFVAFESYASDLVAIDANATADVFLRDRGPATFAPFCAGDGSAAPCPCGNTGAVGRGCDNSLGTGGARLAASGLASVSSDSLVLAGSGMTPSTCVYLQGDAVLGLGSGTPFGDGLRCVGGTIARLGTEVNGPAGSSSHGAPVGDVPISVRGAIGAGGGVRHYQIWYRDAAPFCTPDTFGLSNALTVVWVP